MEHVYSTGVGASSSELTQRVRDLLCNTAKQSPPVTYQSLAKTLELSPPNTILQLTDALERLIAEDIAAGRPLIAALVISRARGGLPAPGFFECARRLGRFPDTLCDTEDKALYAAEFDRAVDFWSKVAPSV